MKHTLLVTTALTAMVCVAIPALSEARDNGNPLMEPKKIFLTSEAYTGDLVGEAEALLSMFFADGLEAADAICQFHAQLGALNGRYVALLSTSTVAAAGRLTPTVGPYVRVDGVPVAASFAALFSTRGAAADDHAIRLITSPDMNEMGERLRSPDPAGNAWTGTNSNGSLDRSGPGGFLDSVAPELSFCNDWTDNDQPVEPDCHHSIPDQQPCGLTGRSRFTDSDWLQYEFVGCNNMRRLYCAQR